MAGKPSDVARPGGFLLMLMPHTMSAIGGKADMVATPRQPGFQGHFGSDRYFTILTVMLEHVGHSKVRLS